MYKINTDINNELHITEINVNIMKLVITELYITEINKGTNN